MSAGVADLVGARAGMKRNKRLMALCYAIVAFRCTYSQELQAVIPIHDARYKN